MDTIGSYDAVSMPLRGGWRIEWRRKGCTLECEEIFGLPAGWRAVAAAGGPLQVSRGPRGGLIRLNETTSFRLSIEPPEGMSPDVELRVPDAVFTRTSRDREAPSGDFLAVNYLGMVAIVVVRGGVEERLAVEVVSSKFSHAEDFRRMTSDIAAECQQLLLAWNMPAGLPFEKDPVRHKRLLLEQFLFIQQELGGSKLERWIESIRMRPHEELRGESSWKPADLARSTDHLRRPLAFGRSWRESGVSHRPTEVLEVRKRPTLDTAPNRFLKHALSGFATICRDVVGGFSDSKAALGADGPAVRDALSLLSRIEGHLGSGFFREIGEARRIPIESQALQKREGYRDFLRIWLLAGQAARLNWEGRGDVFNATVRNVAALYEYWLFFVLRKIIKKIPRIKEIPLEDTMAGDLLPAFCERNGLLEIRLKRGKGSLVAFEYDADGPDGMRIHFCFDRTYSPAKHVLAGGAYSKSFRPDFSMVIFPAKFAASRTWEAAEKEAELSGRISYLHFDAKYRVDGISELFPADNNELLDEEETGKATNTYRRADLYKMHTYNDAIRRTVGSYVLYPGNGEIEEKYNKYHELLPGLGAFAVCPSAVDVAGQSLSAFLLKVLQCQRDRFSQLARIDYWTHDTIREQPSEYHISKSIPYNRPPKDTSLVLGFVRSGEDPEIYRENRVFFCHAVEWQDSSLPPAMRTPTKATKLGFDPLRADLLGIYQAKASAPWLAKVLDVRIVSAEERAQELDRSLASMKAAYYYRIQLGDFHDEPSRDISNLIKSRSGKPFACTLDDLARCKPLYHSI
jgi:predicted component of viral defense system (DUF524 family)